MMAHLTPEEMKKFHREVPDYMDKILIERAYDKLVAYTYKRKSRLAFMVLGCFLMLSKGRMSEEES